jgi:integrase
VISANPARIKGAGGKRRARELRVLTISEFGALVSAMPPRYKALVLLGGWCALRFGELAALRPFDLDLRNGVVHVRQAVTAVKGRGSKAEECGTCQPRRDPTCATSGDPRSLHGSGGRWARTATLFLSRSGPAHQTKLSGQERRQARATSIGHPSAGAATLHARRLQSVLRRSTPRMLPRACPQLSVGVPG